MKNETDYERKPKNTDEEITELWLETAIRGSIYYYESKLENPKLSDADISRNYRDELVEIKENVYSNYNHWYANKRIYAITFFLSLVLAFLQYWFSIHFANWAGSFVYTIFF